MENETVKQHLVPRCYLKNFKVQSIHKKKKTIHFVDALDKKNPKNEPFRANIAEICTKEHWYTFTKLDGKDRMILEHYYARTIEREYPNLYRKMVLERPLNLSNRERQEIIKFCVMQYFRTSKLTNQFNNFWGSMFKKADQMAKVHSQPLKIKFEDGPVLDFTGKPLENVIAEQTNSNREYINALTFTWAKEQTNLRKGDMIYIEEVTQEHQLITSDNPVYYFGNALDPTVMMKMPLDSTHLLTIYPAKHYLEGTPRFFFQKLSGEMLEFESTFNNLYQIENAERFIIGEKDSLLRAQGLSKNFDVEAFNSKVKSYTTKLTEQTDYIERTGTLPPNFEI